MAQVWAWTERGLPGRLVWAWWGVVALIAVVTVRDLAAPSQCDTTYVWEGYETVDVASATGSARRYSMVRYKDGPAEEHPGARAGPGSMCTCPSLRARPCMRAGRYTCTKPVRQPVPNKRSLAAGRGGRGRPPRRGGLCARASGQPQAGPLPGFRVGA